MFRFWKIDIRHTYFYIVTCDTKNRNANENKIQKEKITSEFNFRNSLNWTWDFKYSN